MSNERLDILIFGTHPDDAEIGAGGTLIKLGKMGYRTGVVDLTRGEMSTHGTLEMREREVKEAAEIMGLTMRENLNMQDAHIENSMENRIKIARVVCQWRPRIVSCFRPVLSRHPDHFASGLLVRDGCYMAGLKKQEVGNDPFRPDSVIFYSEVFEQNPDFAVDVSEEWETKVKAVMAYGSQMYDERADTEKTESWIKKKSFQDAIENRARFYGGMIGAKYAEAFFFDGLIRLDDVISALSITRVEK